MQRGTAEVRQAPRQRWRAQLGDLLPLRPRDLLATAILALVFWAAAVAGFRFAVGPGVGTAFWPAAGITLAAFILGGVRLWPGVVIGRLLAAFTIGAPQPLWALILLGIAAAIAAAIPAAQFHRMRLPAGLNSLRAMLWLVGSGAAGAAAFSALAGVVILAAVGTPAAALPNIAANWWFGYVTGALTLTPVLLAWRPGAGSRVSRAQTTHLAAALICVAGLAYLIFVRPDLEPTRAWFIFPVLVWAALAFSIRGASLALLIAAGMAFWGASMGAGVFHAGNVFARELLLTQQFVAITTATVLILAAVADERRNQERLKANERRLQAETEALELLNRTGAAIAAELDLDRSVQLITDAAVSLTGAEFGAFFHNVLNDKGESYMLYTLSGVPRSAFERFPQPRNTAVFGPTFAGEGVVRVDDITKDPRYGLSAPYHGMPQGHLPVRSYLAVPVRLRSGEVVGGLFFGHSEVGVFSERSERLLVGIAAQAAVAIDNARLYQAAQREIVERRQAEAHQRLLINELNHRVKNTLATVQSMGAQSLRAGRDIDAAREAFVSRLMALSAAHNLLTDGRWESAALDEVVRMATAPFEEAHSGRFTAEGPLLRLSAPQALALAMSLHELGTNAVKYGALSVDTGKVDIDWSLQDDQRLRLVWRETGGPRTSEPATRGFGSRLIEQGLARELGGDVSLEFHPAGLCCEIVFRPNVSAAGPLAPEPADSRPSAEHAI